MRAAVSQKIQINILRAAMFMVMPLLLFVRPQMSAEGVGHKLMEAVGVRVLIAVVLGGPLPGGRKNSEAMQDGPFSMSRNPLYFFSTIGSFGIGLMMGAFSFAILLGGVMGVVLYATARREAAFLRQEFGATYEDYAARVPFFLPDPRLSRAAPEAVFRTGPLRRNLCDAFVFLSFIPLVELLDLFKDSFGPAGIALW